MNIPREEKDVESGYAGADAAELPTEPQGDTTVTLESEDDLRALAVAGEPHGGRIDQRGPYVL